MMKKGIVVCCVVMMFSILEAQTPEGKKFGFGIILGDPTGLTAKIAVGHSNDIALSVGSSYFGSMRFGMDYTWRFNALHSSVVHIYAGPGGVVGVGHSDGVIYRSFSGRFYYRPAGETGIAVRGIVGVDITLLHDPVEFFVETGPLVGISPVFGTSMDAAIGIRFYP